MQRDYREPGPYVCTMAPHHGLPNPNPIRRALKQKTGATNKREGSRRLASTTRPLLLPHQHNNLYR